MTAVGPRLGILGGGQLARMLAESAMRHGLRVAVLAEAADAPAAIPGVDLVLGALDEPAALEALAARCDVLTVENEFLDLDRLGAVVARHPSVHLHPSRPAIALAQDKLEQKRVFSRLGIPTAEYTLVRVASLDDDLRRAAGRFPGGFVLKWSRFGYDGRGNRVVGRPGAAERDAIAEFCRAGEAAGATIYAERRVDFAAEVAMVSTRAHDGRQVFFPLVVSRQDHGVCREVFGPATAFGVAADIERDVAGHMAALATDLDYCGTFAVEWFIDRDGALLANEMAPRVHNTGHYTLFGDEPSQFDLHVQAVTGRPLSAPAVRDPFVMRNLLGPFLLRGAHPCPAPSEPPPPGTLLYWYDKRTVSAGRKMGHLTGRAAIAGAIERMRDALRDYERRFWAGLSFERQGT